MIISTDINKKIYHNNKINICTVSPTTLFQYVACLCLAELLPLWVLLDGNNQISLSVEAWNAIQTGTPTRWTMISQS